MSKNFGSAWLMHTSCIWLNAPFLQIRLTISFESCICFETLILVRDMLGASRNLHIRMSSSRILALLNSFILHYSTSTYLCWIFCFDIFLKCITQFK